MNELNRRTYLQLAGIGGAALPLAAAWKLGGPARAHLAPLGTAGVFAFRAITGLPAKPLPAYASFVVSGQVDLATRTGTFTQTVMAGGPTGMSDITLPGLSRTVHVTDVQELGDTMRLVGVIDDASQFQPGESLDVEVTIDRASGVLTTSFYGSETHLTLDA